MNKDMKILIVDDEEAYCDVLGMILKTEGYEVRLCTRSKEVIDILKTEDFDLIISDLIMPEMDGLALLKTVKKYREDIFFIMLTAYGTIDNAVKAMKQGAFTYVIKGSDPEELLKEIRNIKKLKQIHSKEAGAQEEQDPEYLTQSKSSMFQEVMTMASKAARSDVNILILGESGAGKEFIAQFIHNESNRCKNGFLRHQLSYLLR